MNANHLKIYLHLDLCYRRSNKIAGQGILGALLATLSQLSLGTMVLHGQDITQSLRETVSSLFIL